MCGIVCCNGPRAPRLSQTFCTLGEWETAPCVKIFCYCLERLINVSFSAFFVIKECLYFSKRHSSCGEVDR